MATYIALLCEDDDGVFHVSFPDIPGLITAGDDFDEALEEAAEALASATEDWTGEDGAKALKAPRTLEQLQADPAFLEASENAEICEIDLVPSAADQP